MPRTLAAELEAALSGGSFDPIIRVYYAETAWDSPLTCQVVRYRQSQVHLSADFYLPDDRLAVGEACIRLERGVKLAGLEYTVLSAWYYASNCTQTKKLVHFEGYFLPAKLRTLNTSQTYRQVIYDYFNDESIPFDFQVYKNASKRWPEYQFEPDGSQREYRTVDSFMSDLRTKRFIFAADDQNAFILMTAGGDDTQGEVPDHVVTPTLLDTLSLRTYEINYQWRDETGTGFRQANDSFEAQHNLGYLRSTDGLPVATSCAVGSVVTLPIHLKYLTGDSVQFNLPDGSSMTFPVLVAEVFDSGKYPAWFVELRPLPLVGMETGLANTDNMIITPGVGGGVTLYGPGLYGTGIYSSLHQYGAGVYGSSVYTTGGSLEHAEAYNYVRWIVQVDWDKDGSWGGESDIDIRHLTITRGRSRRVNNGGNGQQQPSEERFTLRLFDQSGKYDGFNAESTLYSFLGGSGYALRVLLVSTNDRTPCETVFVGTLRQVDYNQATSTTVLSGEGLSSFLSQGAAQALWTACQYTNGGNDSYFVMDGSTPFPINYWKGRPEGLPLRSMAALTLARAGYPFGGYYGASIVNNEEPEFFYFDGSSAWAILEDLANAFAARLFPLRDGRIFVMDRNDTTGINVGAAAPLGTQQEIGLARMSPAASLRNTVHVSVRPHAMRPWLSPFLNEYYLEAWSNAGPVAIAPLQTVEIDVRYPVGLDLAGVGSFLSINASGGLWPVEMECWSLPSKSGTRMDSSGSGDGEFAIVWEDVPGTPYFRPYGDNQSWGRVKFRNYHATDTAYFFNCKVMLIGLRETGNAATAKAVDSGSVAQNGPRTLTISSKWVQTADQGAVTAQAYADDLSAREKASPATITYRWLGQQIYNNLLTYDLGAFVNFGLQGDTVSLQNFGMHGKWLVVGQVLRFLGTNDQEIEAEITYEYIGASPVLTLERSSSEAGGTPGSSITWAHQIDDHENRLLVVGVSVRAYQTVYNVTYGGANLTKKGTAQYDTADNPRVELWYLAAPAVGTANIVVTLTGADYAQAVASSFYNAHQKLPLGVLATDNGDSAKPDSLEVWGSAGNMIIDVFGYRGADATIGGGQTSLGHDSSDGYWKVDMSYATGAASVYMHWNHPAASWAHLGVAVRQAV